MKSVSKFKHQVKSSKYYLFWGAATIAVMAGQIYVGNGYRRMSESMDGISADINLLVEVLTYVPEPRGRYEPLLQPPTGISKNPLTIPFDEMDPDDYIIWLETK